MSSPSRPRRVLGATDGVLRGSRLGGEVLLGADGRVQPAPAPESLEEMARLQEAADIVSRAREHADLLRQQAALDATAIQHDAYREGREQGYREGAAAARAELAEALALVQAAAREGKAMRDRLLWGAEREIVELVVAAARTVVGGQASLSPELVLETVERALARAGAENLVRLRVNPRDHAIVAASVTGAHGDAPPFEVIGDGAVGIGGCVVDTRAGSIDARLDAQLDSVAQLLLAAVPDTTPGQPPEAPVAAGGTEDGHAG